jgi:transposase
MPVLKQPFNGCAPTESEPPSRPEGLRDWKRLSAIGIVSYAPRTGQAGIFYSLRPGNVDSDWVISIVRCLRRHIRSRVVLLWDGLPAHRSAETTAFLETQGAWLQVEPLPAYAPEFNPVEPMWANLSARELANLCPETLGELEHHVRRGVRRIRRDCHLGLAFLKHSGLFPELSL